MGSRRSPPKHRRPQPRGTDTRPPASGNPAGAATRRSSRPPTSPALTLACLVVIALATAVTFAPAAANQFLYWDDDSNLMFNPHIRDFSAENLEWMWTGRLLGVWQPLTWMITGLEYRILGGEDLERFSRGMHQISIGLHAVAAVLVFFVARRLIALGAPNTSAEAPSALTIGATIAALLFAVHPLRVETTAWASGQAYVLAMIPALGVVLCYLRANESGRSRRLWHGLALLCLTASLACKAMAVPLVAVLLVLDVYPLRRFGRSGERDWRTVTAPLLEKIPYAAITVVAVVLNVWATQTTKAYEPEPAEVKILVSSFCMLFYVAMTFVPNRPAPYYMKPHPFEPFDPWFAGAAVLFVAVTIAVVVMRRRRPWLLATWCCYVVVLLPVVGLIKHGGQMAADRYTYLSCIGWVILIGAGVTRLWAGSGESARPVRRLGVMLAAAAAIVVLSSESRAYCLDWKDSESVWAAMVRRNPRFEMGYYNLAKANKRPCAALTRRANEEAQAGRAEAAETLRQEVARRYALAESNFRKAIALYPEYPKANVDLGNMIGAGFAPGGVEAAEQHYLAALRGAPTFHMAHLNLGWLRLRQKRYAEAESHFLQAARGAKAAGQSQAYRRAQEGLKKARQHLGNNP